MKKIFILHILFLFMIGLNAQTYETQTHLKRFGYTTSVGQPVNYNSNVNMGNNTHYGSKYGYTTINYGYQTMQYNSNNIYNGTYNPGSHGNSGSSGYHGGIRKVHGYTENGEYVGDDNGEESDFWETGYKYYWDDVEKCWYRQGSDGWRKYNNTLGFLFGWHWALTSWGGRKEPENPVSESFKKRPEHPDDPNPTPLNDGLIILLSMSLLYIGYIAKKVKSANV